MRFLLIAFSNKMVRFLLGAGRGQEGLGGSSDGLTCPQGQGTAPPKACCTPRMRLGLPGATMEAGGWTVEAGGGGWGSSADTRWVPGQREDTGRGGECHLAPGVCGSSSVSNHKEA